MRWRGKTRSPGLRASRESGNLPVGVVSFPSVDRTTTATLAARATWARGAWTRRSEATCDFRSFASFDSTASLPLA
jgi:hypothetical protein